MMTPNLRKLEAALMVEYAKVCLALVALYAVDIEFCPDGRAASELREIDAEFIPEAAPRRRGRPRKVR
jgi:hypothetical protein